MAVVVHGGYELRVGVEIEAAGLGGQVEGVDWFLLIGIPEEEVAAIATGAGDEGAVGVKAGAPEGVAGEAFGEVIFGDGGVFPGEAQGEGFLHIAERIGGFAEAGGDQPLAIGAEGERPHAAVMDLLSSFVHVERGGVECPLSVTGGGGPLVNFAIEIAAEKGATVG